MTVCDVRDQNTPDGNILWTCMLSLTAPLSLPAGSDETLSMMRS